MKAELPLKANLLQFCLHRQTDLHEGKIACWSLCLHVGQSIILPLCRLSVILPSCWPSAVGLSVCRSVGPLADGRQESKEKLP